MPIKPLFAIVSFLFFLIGCAEVQQNGSLHLSWLQRQEQLSKMVNWQFRGDFIVKMPGYKQHANIFWQEQAGAYSVMIFGPFGLGEVHLRGSAKGVFLKDSTGQVYSAQSPEVLMQNQCGWTMPISSLYYWVRGLPAPDKMTHVTYDSFHRIDMLEQEGWQIHYLDYQRVQALELPQKVTFTRGTFYLELAIDKGGWQLGAFDASKHLN